jgi:hypothetical protein
MQLLMLINFWRPGLGYVLSKVQWKGFAQMSFRRQPGQWQFPSVHPHDRLDVSAVAVPR